MIVVGGLYHHTSLPLLFLILNPSDFSRYNRDDIVPDGDSYIVVLYILISIVVV